MSSKDLKFLLAFYAERFKFRATVMEVVTAAGRYIEEATQYYDIAPDEAIDYFLK